MQPVYFYKKVASSWMHTFVSLAISIVLLASITLRHPSKFKMIMLIIGAVIFGIATIGLLIMSIRASKKVPYITLLPDRMIVDRNLSGGAKVVNVFFGDIDHMEMKTVRKTYIDGDSSSSTMMHYIVVYSNNPSLFFRRNPQLNNNRRSTSRTPENEVFRCEINDVKGGFDATARTIIGTFMNYKRQQQQYPQYQQQQQFSQPQYNQYR